MKETLLTNCEKSFVLEAISKAMRLDGRELDECRELQIYFGTDFGSCQVSLGNTKVLAQVSCEVTEPSTTRPNEGKLFLNVEFSPMGAPHFEVGRPTELAVQVNRLLEKCIKDSHCVDLESLCITAEEKVWALRVDVNVLNADGSLSDAASVAALAALAHFRRPDATTAGDQTVIHDPSERDPIPLTLHHYPVCVTYAFFNAGNNFVADPTDVEERVSEAQVAYGVNSYRELCSLHLGGSALQNTQVLLRCANKAAARAAAVVLRLKEALRADTESRAADRQPDGFVRCVREGSVFAQRQAGSTISLSSLGLRAAAKRLGRRRRGANAADKMEVGEGGDEDDDNDGGDEVVALGNGTAQLAGPGEAAVVNSSSEEEEESEVSDIEVVNEVTAKEKRLAMAAQAIELSDGSEEEATVTLQEPEINSTKKTFSKKQKGKTVKRT